MLIFQNISIPLLPKHWQKVNPYARRVKTLRRSPIQNMEQILTSLKIYDRGSETPCIFPRLQCLIWNYGTEVGELPLVANLFFRQTLKEICIRNDEYPDPVTPGEQTPGGQTPRSQLGDQSNFGSSISVPFSIISECHFPVLTKIYLPISNGTGESLSNYHTAAMDLLRSFPEWQLQDVSIILTREILYLLGTFSDLRSVELHDLVIDPSDVRAWDLEGKQSFKNLRSLTIRSLRSPTSLADLEYSQCIPSHRMKVVFSNAYGNHANQHHGFYQIIHLLSRKATLESLEVEGAIDLTVFLEPLFALSNLQELVLGRGVHFDIRDDTIRLMSTKWPSLTHLSLHHNQGNHVSLNGIAFLNRCPIQYLRLAFMLTRNDISSLRQRLKTSNISSLHSLKHFQLTELVHSSDGDIAGTVLALAYLFPHAKFVYDPVREPPDTYVQEVLRVRTVVLELLKDPDIVGLSQI